MKSERTVTIPLDEYMELVEASKNQEKIYFESVDQILFGTPTADQFVYVGHDETIAAITKSLNTELSSNWELRTQIEVLKLDLAKCEDRAEHREPEPPKRRWRI